ncbi:MAG TPA: tetratricopeptide repeat protein [bacterium]|nr:tetratricopeptide repeat protein [bacterium]
MDQEKINKAPDHAPGRWTRAARFHLVPALIIAAFCLLIYGNTFHAPFTFDDQTNITENPYIRINRISAGRLLLAAVQDRFQLRFLSNLSFALDYYFHGLDRRWMHAENIAIHALAALLLYLIVYSLVPLVTASPPPEKQRRAASLFAALVWAAHPAHTQAVTYLVQRQTALAVAAMLASFLAFVRARAATGTRRRALYAGAFAAFLIAAGSKEIGWTVPAYWILFVLLLEPREKSGMPDRKTMVRLITVLVIAAAAALAALLKTGILAAYFGKYGELGYGPGRRLLTEARVFASYLATMIFPHPARLTLDHDVMVSRSLLDPWTTLPALLLVAAVISAIMLCRRRRPLISFLGLGLLLALALESSIIPVDLMADHRLYLASIFVLPPAAAALFLTLGPRRAWPPFVLIIIFMGLLTMSRNRTWNIAAGIWTDAAKKSPGLPRPWSNLCGDLNKARLFDRALTACDLAIALKPDKAQPFINKAVTLMDMGRKDEAGTWFAKAAADYGEEAGAQYNYGAYLDLQGRPDEAIEYYRNALKADQFYQPARLALARDLRKAGKPEEAMKVISLAPVLFPDSSEAWLELARTAVWAGDFNLAAMAAGKAYLLDPTTEPLLLLGTAEMLAGKGPEAERAFRAALALDPLNQRAWMGLAKLDLDRGDLQAAAADAARVRRSGPLQDEVEAELRELEAQIISRSRPAAP